MSWVASSVSFLLAGCLIALVYWLTGSTLSLAVAPALLGLSFLMVDHAASVLGRRASRYRFGAVHYGVLAMFGVGPLIALLLTAPT